MGQPLSETENLLWNLGRDPNLASTMGIVALLDGRPDPERLRTTMVNTVASVERLRQRVTGPSGPGGLPAGLPGGLLGQGRPSWSTDRWFDLDHHLRFVALRRSSGDGPAGLGDLRRLAVQLINDPFDETRPLWQFHLVTGLRGGHSALIGKVHHSISDGIGLLRLAGSLLEFEADAPPPERADLAALLAAEARAEDRAAGVLDGEDEASRPEGTGGAVEPGQQATDESGSGSGGWLRDLVTGATRLPGPGRVIGTGAGVVASARAVTDQLPRHEASPLWATRSRNRRLELCAFPLDSVRTAARERDCTLNDLFVAACGQAAVHYHREEGAERDDFIATVVISTEASDADGPLGSGGDNAFVPVPIELPGTSASAEDRLDAVRSGVRRRRQAVVEGRPDVLLGAIGGLVPSSVAAALALQQAAKVDFATSNIPGPPMPTWLAGRPVQRIHPVGPVAGTAFNATFVSHDREALLGLHIDPAAVTRPDLLARCVQQGFRDFGVRQR